MSTTKKINQKLELNSDTINLLKNTIETNNSFLRLLLDTIPSPVFYKDKLGVYQHCNDAFSKTILGIPKEKIIGKSLYDLPDVIPKELADIYYQKDLELFKSVNTQFYEAKVKCSDGVERYYNFYKASLVSSENEIIGLVGVMLDVSDYKNIQLELEQKNQKLKALSTTDDLTNLYNRRYFEKIFEKNIETLNRTNKGFAFALIDIDYFKNYNDGFGHAEGDKALIKVSNTLKKSLNRVNDLVFRVGGEEFAIIIDFVDSFKVIELFNKILKNIEEQKIETFNKNVSNYLTVSIGLGIIKNKNKEPHFKRYLYNEIDNLLYKSKKDGRNRLTHKQF